MKRSFPVAAILLAAALAVAGCASPGSQGRDPTWCPIPDSRVGAAPSASPCFALDGSVRRDAATGAPVFLAPRETAAAVAPRFNADGTVARDPGTGAPVAEEKAEGRVVRVLVLVQ